MNAIWKQDVYREGNDIVVHDYKESFSMPTAPSANMFFVHGHDDPPGNNTSDEGYHANNTFTNFNFGTTTASRTNDIFKYAAKGNLPKAFKGFSFAGNAISVISIFGDAMYLSYNTQNLSYGEIQKVQVDITSNTLTLFPVPQVQAAGVIMNLIDAVGGFDWMYNNSNRLQQAGFPYLTTNPFNNPAFIWINKP
jgi:hypothetical protein